MKQQTHLDNIDVIAAAILEKMQEKTGAQADGLPENAPTLPPVVQLN